jgi:hypothetical protein
MFESFSITVRFPKIRHLLSALIALATGLVAPPAAEAMTFSLARLQGQGLCKPDCPMVIFANGAITAESPNEFAAFLTRTPDIAGVRSAIMINSPGGQVVGAMLLGLMRKELKMTTFVAQPVVDTSGNAVAIRSARCYSACTYALMGARVRIVPDGSQVGVHRMHSFNYARDPADNRYETRHIFAPAAQVEILRRYTQIVGIDSRLVDIAESVDPTAIRVLTPAEMRALRVTTTVLGEKPGRKRRQAR